MLLEHHSLDWLFVFFNFSWILGISILLIVLSDHGYSGRRSGVKISTASAAARKRAVLIGLALAISGSLLALVHGAKSIGKTRFTFRDATTFDREPLEGLAVNGGRSFSNQEIEMHISDSSVIEKAFPLTGDLIYMPWDGRVGTPFMDFGPGAYEFQFEAHGSKANDEFSIIRVYIARLKKDKLVLEKFIKDIELTKARRRYALVFEVTKKFSGKVIVEFINNGGDAQGGERDVWINSFKIIKAS